MKVIKKFENYKEEYKTGDYIVLDWDVLFKHYNAKIIAKNLECDIYKLIVNEKSGDYFVEFYSNEIKKKFYLKDIEIKRKATPEEIEDYKIRKAIEKFNI